MQYKYYRISFGICMQSLRRFGGKLCNRSLGVHEPKMDVPPALNVLVTELNILALRQS